MSSFADGLRDLGRMQSEVKRRAMIFQVEEKERRAKELRLPYWAFYHMAYKELHLIEDDETARAWFAEHGPEAAAEEAASYAGTHAPEGMVDELKAQCLEESLKYVGDRPVSKVSDPVST